MELERKVVFLDRDRTINVQRHDEENDRRNYVLEWEDFEFIPYSDSAIRYLLENGYVVVVVSNQACVGKGYCTKEDMSAIFGRMWVDIDPPIGSKYHTYACPHIKKDDCVCRKPKPGLMYAAAFQEGLCLKEAWMVGDSRDDMRAGWAATIRKLILINPEVPVLEPGPKERRVAQPTVAPSLAIAAAYIVGIDEKQGVFNEDKEENI